MLHNTDEIRTKLDEAEHRLRDLTQERRRALDVQDAAKAAFEASAGEEDGPSYDAAKKAIDAVKAVEQRIDTIKGEQTGLLRQLGDAESGRAGFAYPGIDGWEVAARELDLAGGNLRAEVAAATLLRSPVVPPSTAPAAVPPKGGRTAAHPSSNRWTYPVFDVLPFGTGIHDLTATDFTIEFGGAGATGLTGVEIETASDDEKAELPATVGLASPHAKTFAVYADDVPSKLFDSQQTVRAFLSVEMDRRLSEAYDAHVIGKIEAATPPNGNTGANLIERIRRGIAQMRNRGGDPSVVTLTPEQAADLDLSTHPDGDKYLFLPGDSQNTVWRLLVRESPSLDDPLLIDPSRLGVNYVGEGSVLVDPFSSMTTNRVRVRVEIEAVYHVRNISQGAYRIG